MIQIKRLKLSGSDFVPVTLSEAVVVNCEDNRIPGLSSLGITTLDKVLYTALGITNSNQNSVTEALNKINEDLANKQDSIKFGSGFEIGDDGTVNVKNDFELYKIVSELPSASEDCKNTIYLLPSTLSENGNIFAEYLCVLKDDVYIWEKIGEIQASVDLSGYVTNETFNEYKNTADVTYLKAENVLTSSGSNVVVNYDIPDTLYDTLVNT